MADLTVQDFTDEDGGAIVFSAADVAGDKFVYSDRALIIVRNADAAAHTVTVTPSSTSTSDSTHGELTRDSIVLTVAAGATALIPPLPRVFRHRTDAGKVPLTYDAVTGLTVAIVRVP